MEYDFTDESSDEAEFTLGSDDEQDWKTPLENSTIDPSGVESGLRPISPPQTQRGLTHRYVGGAYMTLDSTRNENRAGVAPSTSTNDSSPSTASQSHQRLPSRPAVEMESLASPPTHQDIRSHHQTKKPLTSYLQTPTQHQRNSWANFMLEASTPGGPSGPDSDQRLQSTLPAVQGYGPQIERFGKRDHSALGRQPSQEDSKKKTRVDAAQNGASLPLLMQMNTILLITVNGNKEQRRKQQGFSEYGSMAELFAEVAGGWQDQGVDEKDCYIEASYGRNHAEHSSNAASRVVYLERERDDGLELFLEEIRRSGGWKTANQCVVEMKICQKY